MVDLWFDGDHGPLFRRGESLYARRPDEPRGVLRQEVSTAGVPDDLVEQGEELLGRYGVLVGGAADQLDSAGVSLPAELQRWGTAQDRPAAELGGWEPTLIAVDGVAHLALRRPFDEVCAYAITFRHEHIIVIAPTAEDAIRLVHRTDLDVSAPGWEPHAF